MLQEALPEVVEENKANVARQGVIDVTVEGQKYSFQTTFGTDAAEILEGNGILAAAGGDDKVIGGKMADLLDGGAGNDTLYGGEGNNKLSGGDQDDLLIAGTGAEKFDGGAGLDKVSYWKADGAVQVYLWDITRNRGWAASDTYSGVEVIDGSKHGDVLEGDAHVNSFWGDAGHDSLKGAAGDDVLSGGEGNDYLRGDEGADRLDGGADQDTASYYGAAAGVLIDLDNLARNRGDAAGDVYVSIEAFDGSTHNDTIEGRDGYADTFFGDAGNDLLKGRGNTDNLMGGAGDDHLMGGAHGDRLDGSEGFDVADYSEATSGVLVDRSNMSRNTGEAQNDIYISIEGVKGSTHRDELYGAAGWDGFYAGAGDDVLEGRGGGDHLNGGDGFDYAAYWSAGTAVRASLLKASINTGDAAGDEYVSIEGLDGSGYGDMLQGDVAGNGLYGRGGGDLLLGEGGNDYVEGGDGADTIAGGEGQDWLLGNAGADVFRFDTWASAGNVDTLADFSVAQGDRIALATNVFTAFAPMASGVTSALTSSAFGVGTKATTSAQRIVYDQATGALYYDADGTGAAGQVQFAKVSAYTALTAASFQLFTL